MAGKAPERCGYCDGEGNSSAGGECGFCDHGKPLDSQADWDASWGRLHRFPRRLSHRFKKEQG